MGPPNLSPLLFLLKNASKILSVIRERSPWGGESGTEIKPKGSTIIVPVLKLSSNTVASRIIQLALTTLLNVISEQLGYAGTNNVSADVNSEGI